MKTSSKKLFNNIKEFTSYVNLNYIDKILHNESYQHEPQRFLYTILYKLNNGLSSCDCYILNFDTCERHLDSLFLILRTLLSDSIMCHYVIQKGDKSDEQVISNIMSLYYDHFEYGIINLKKYGKTFWNYSQEYIDSEIQNLKKNNTGFFNDDGSNKYKSLHINIATAVSCLAGNNKAPIRYIYQSI